MKKSTAAILGLLAFLTMLLASCGSGGGFVSENRSNRGYNPGVGPFDSQGNYVERWANDKSKGRWWRKSRISGPSDVTPATPVTPPVTPPPPPVIASSPTPTPIPATRSISPPPRPPVRSTVTPTPRPKPTVVSKPKPKPKPQPTVKTTPKLKAPVRYTVKKGDTLWSISRRYNTTVAAIQRANGIKDTNLKIGRALVIPMY